MARSSDAAGGSADTDHYPAEDERGGALDGSLSGDGSDNGSGADVHFGLGGRLGRTLQVSCPGCGSRFELTTRQLSELSDAPSFHCSVCDTVFAADSDEGLANLFNESRRLREQIPPRPQSMRQGMLGAFDSASSGENEKPAARPRKDTQEFRYAFQDAEKESRQMRAREEVRTRTAVQKSSPSRAAENPSAERQPQVHTRNRWSLRAQSGAEFTPLADDIEEQGEQHTALRQPRIDDQYAESTNQTSEFLNHTDSLAHTDLQNDGSSLEQTGTLKQTGKRSWEQLSMDLPLREDEPRIARAQVIAPAAPAAQWPEQTGPEQTGPEQKESPRDFLDRSSAQRVVDTARVADMGQLTQTAPLVHSGNGNHEAALSNVATVLQNGRQPQSGSAGDLRETPLSKSSSNGSSLGVLARDRTDSSDRADSLAAKGVAVRETIDIEDGDTEEHLLSTLRHEMGRHEMGRHEMRRHGTEQQKSAVSSTGKAQISPPSDAPVLASPSARGDKTTRNDKAARTAPRASERTRRDGLSPWKSFWALSLALLAILLVPLAAFIALRLNANQSFLTDLLPSNISPPPAGLFVREARFRTVALEDGEKVGMVVGVVQNSSSQTVSDLTLEAFAFDKNGATVNVTKVPLGATLAGVKLRSRSQKQIEEAQSGKVTRRVQLPPGEEKEFSIVFLGIAPADISEFGVRVYSATLKGQ